MDQTEREADRKLPTADLVGKVLILYPSRSDEEGDYWTANHGNVEVPEGWEFLPRGDMFLTKRVKQGPHWVLKGRRNRKKGYTPVHGVFAPASAIREAEAAAEATNAKRGKAREAGRAARDREEEQYRATFEEACLKFLDFAPRYRNLAVRIARETTAHACQKHSRRVGRTRLIDLEDRAALAVRANLRHRYTRYEFEVAGAEALMDDEAYRLARANAHENVDLFLEKHRMTR